MALAAIVTSEVEVLPAFPNELPVTLVVISSLIIPLLIFGVLSYLRLRWCGVIPGNGVSLGVARKVRSAVARVFVQSKRNSDTLPPHVLAKQVGCGVLISPDYILTCSHILPDDWEQHPPKVWVLIGSQMKLRTASVVVRLDEENEDIALLKLKESVTDIESLHVCGLEPRLVRTMAMIGFPQVQIRKWCFQSHILRVKSTGSHCDDLALTAVAKVRLIMGSIAAQVAIFALDASSFAVPGRSGIEWYMCSPGMAGSPIVNVVDGAVIGVHKEGGRLGDDGTHDFSSPLFLVDHNIASGVSIRMEPKEINHRSSSWGPKEDWPNPLGTFQILAHDSVLLELRRFGIVAAKDICQLAHPSTDADFYDYDD